MVCSLLDIDAAIALCGVLHDPTEDQSVQITVAMALDDIMANNSMRAAELLHKFDWMPTKVCCPFRRVVLPEVVHVIAQNALNDKFVSRQFQGR